MSFFQDAVQENRHVKAMVQGRQGAGKTFTTALFAIGAVERSGSRGPVYYVDTEGGSDYVLRLFKARGIEVRRVRKDQLKAAPKKSPSGKVSESQTMKNFAACCLEAKRDGASALIVDSLSWFWGEMVDEFAPRELRDWQAPKSAWRRCVEYLMVDAPYHVFACARTANDYEEEVNERTGKAAMVKVGLKAKAEGETGYEPSLVLQMESRVERGGHVVEATVLKDRTQAMPMGRIVKAPTFASFEAIWERMAWGAPAASPAGEDRASGPEQPPAPEAQEEPEASPDMFEGLELREGWAWPQEASAYERPWTDTDADDPEAGQFLDRFIAHDESKGRQAGSGKPTGYGVALAGLKAGWSPREMDGYLVHVEGWEGISAKRAASLFAWLATAATARALAFEGGRE